MSSHFTVLLVFLLAILQHSTPCLTQPSPESVQCPPGFSDASCNVLFVPLDHSDPVSIRIPIFYAVLFPTVPFDNTTATLFIPGGPGSSFFELGPVFRAILTQELVDTIKRPVIIIDPRGTGSFSKISCTLLPIPSFTTPRINVADAVLRLRDCYNQAGAQAIHYSTNSVVKDLELLRAAINIKQFDLFGFSYGAYISQLYATVYPNVIRSLLLDSPLPLQEQIYGQLSIPEIKRIYDLRNRDTPGYNFSSFIENLTMVLRRLRSSPELRQQLRLTPRGLFNLYASTEDQFIPAIAAAAAGNFTSLGIFRDEVGVDDDFRGSPIAIRATVFCNDRVKEVPWDPSAGVEERLLSFADDVVLNVDPELTSPFSITEAISRVQACLGFPFPQLLSEGIPTDIPKRLRNDIPALVLIGDIDSITPLETSRALLDPVLTKKIAVVKNGQHTLLVRGDPCANGLILEFLVTRNVRNLTSCSRSM